MAQKKTTQAEQIKRLESRVESLTTSCCLLMVAVAFVMCALFRVEDP